MVTINNLKAKGYFKIRIELATAFDKADLEEAEQAEAWGDAYIDIRELTAQEAAEFQTDSAKFMDGLERVIVGHNLTQDDEGKKQASNEQVADAIKRSSTVYTHVMSEWMQHLPLAKRSGASSEKLPKT